MITVFVIIFIFVCENYSVLNKDLKDEKCAEFPKDLMELQLELKWSSLWHWKYVYQEIIFQNQCPSLNHDVAAYAKGKLVARSHTSPLKLSNQLTTIYDCNGDIIFEITTGSFLMTLSNTNSFLVSFMLQDIDGNVISYIKTNNFFNLMSTYDITNVKGEVIAIGYKSLLSLNSIKLKILDPKDSGADIRALGIMFSKMHFAFNSKSNDLCNNFFMFIGIAAACMILFLLFFFKIYFCNRGNRNYA